jgi:5S rRNA maturation endonuclease (ribonuclease M5)
LQIGTILNKLTHVKKLAGGEYQADCPCPGHTTPAKHLNVKDSGDKILVTCQGGQHTFDDICQAIDLTANDFFKDTPKPVTTVIKTKQATPPEKIVATYDYLDENRNLLFQVVRYDPKDFRQRHKNGNGEWAWNLEGVKRVLYHLPEIMQVTDEEIYVVEGEKDCDRLWEWGLCSTTSSGGAAGWKPEYAEYLKGKLVTIIPDKDKPGFDYARNIAKSLEGKAEVKVIILPGENVKDASDWLAAGGDVDDLPKIAQDKKILFEQDNPKYQVQNKSVYWIKLISDHTLTIKADEITKERTGTHAKISLTLDYTLLGYGYFNIDRADERISLANKCFESIGKTLPEYTKPDLHRDLNYFCAGLWDYFTSTSLPEFMIGDNTAEPIKFILKPYILDGGGTILFAPPGRGKSNTALLWSVSVHNGVNKFWQVSKTSVLYINLERSKKSLARRLATINKVLGLPPETPLPTLNARGKSLNEVMASCQKFITINRIKLIVLDSISRAGYGDLNENRPVNAIIDALSGLCDTWLAIGHTPRADETHIFGGIHFDAGADIVVQLSSEIKEDKTLGIGYQITKANDIAHSSMEIMALEFQEDTGLVNVRRAKPNEFPQVEGNGREDMLTTLIDYVQNLDTGDVTATQAEKDTGFNRVNINKLFRNSGRFKVTRKDKREVYYGVLC